MRRKRDLSSKNFFHMGKKFLSMILVITILVGILIAIPYKVTVSAETKEYLCLVQDADGKWYAYTDFADVPADGEPDIDTKEVVEALGFSYKKMNTYKFYSLTDKITKDYQNLGYAGVVCYSQKEKIDTLPGLQDISWFSEIQRAIDYGFVPNEIQKNLENTISYSQYCKMLSNMIALYDKELVSKFNKDAVLALKSSDTMRRDDGMLALYYAALAMGIGEEDDFDLYWRTVHGLCGESAWDYFKWNYPYFPEWKKARLYGGDYMTTAYFYSVARFSRISGKTPFDFDIENRSMHTDQKFTRWAAICSVLRLYESTLSNETLAKAEDVTTSWCVPFLKQTADKRRQILQSETEIRHSNNFVPGETYTGKAYYVSNSGNDNQNGLTPKSAWKTLSRLNSSKVEYGDAVFFERGSIWREQLLCSAGVTYSSYGSGEKPRFYGSNESGADKAKWILWHEGKDGEKIWLFKGEVADCGGIVFNDGAAYASRVYAYWNGDKYMCTDDPKRSFDIITALDHDFKFYSNLDLTNVKYLNNTDSQHKGKFIPIYDMKKTGMLYLRCDKGNPASIYNTIEFQTQAEPGFGYSGLIMAKDAFENGPVLDNLCVKYAACIGIGLSKSSNSVIQNCEVGWIGGDTHEYRGLQEDGSVVIPVAGDGIKIEGCNNTVRNCYVHDIFDGGILCELDDFCPDIISGLSIESNLIEYCGNGIIIADHGRNALFSDITIKGNDILYSGYGWSSDENYNCTWMDAKSYSCSITFWEDAIRNNGIYITDNVFYMARYALIHHAISKEYKPVMSGNTYVQGNNGLLAALDEQICGIGKYDDIIAAAKNFVFGVIGDKSANIIPTN